MGLPKCSKSGECSMELEASAHKRRTRVAAACAACEFNFEVAEVSSTAKGINGSRSRSERKGNPLVQTSFDGQIPKGLDLGQVTGALREVLFDPELLRQAVASAAMADLEVNPPVIE